MKLNFIAADFLMSFLGLIEDKIEDSEWLSELVRISLDELPAPKPKKKK